MVKFVLKLFIMQFNIRKAKASDMKEVHRLICELATFEQQPEAVEIKIKDLKKDGFGKKPSFKVFLAEHDGAIIGMALIYPRYSTWKGKTIHLEDLIVQEDFRGKGVGKALYSKVLNYASKKNIKRVAWEVLDWNTNAIAFYESTGAQVFDNWRIAQINNENLMNYLKSNQ